MLIKQRDNEIAILVGYLNKKKEGGGDTGVPVHRAPDLPSSFGQSSSNMNDTTTSSA
jgi:hypothetical protein